MYRQKRRFPGGEGVFENWLLRRAADVTCTHRQKAHTETHDRGIPLVSTHTCRQRTLLKRDANRRLIDQLVVAHVKHNSEIELYALYIEVCHQNFVNESFMIRTKNGVMIVNKATF